MKKLSFKVVLISVAYLLVLFHSLWTMSVIMSDAKDFNEMLARFGLVLIWGVILLFCGLFIYDLAKEKKDEQ
jgi:uncharacterized membrane protein